MMREIAAHPDAAIFPMMSQEELADLAEDIKANGQRFPIIIGQHEGKEVIIDGRNRFAACEIAGVEPVFEQIDGREPKDLILSANINRRHLTAGQRAMAVAIIYPDPQRYRRGGKSCGLQQLDADKSVLSRARTIYRHSRPLADAVMSGTIAFDVALAQAKTAADAQKSAEAMLARLRAEAPDLAELVVEERLQLREGITALDSRIAEAKRARETATRVLQTLFNALFPRSATPEEWAERLTKDVDPEFWSGSDALTSENLAACAAVMAAISMRFNHG